MVALLRHKTNVVDVTVQQTIKVRSRLGSGEADDPVRIITEYYDLKGNLLARVDDTIKDDE